MELQQFEVWVMPVPKRVSLDVSLILESSMCNVNSRDDSIEKVDDADICTVG